MVVILYLNQTHTKDLLHNQHKMHPGSIAIVSYLLASLVLGHASRIITTKLYNVAKTRGENTNIEGKFYILTCCEDMYVLTELVKMGPFPSQPGFLSLFFRFLHSVY